MPALAPVLRPDDEDETGAMDWLLGRAEVLLGSRRLERIEVRLLFVTRSSEGDVLPISYLHDPVGCEKILL